MSYDEELFRSCSKPLQDAFTFLIERHERIRHATLKTIMKWKSSKTLSKKRAFDIKEYEKRLNGQFDMFDAELVYALSHINSDYTKDFMKASRRSDFLEPPTENSKMYYYIYKLGYDGDKLYDFLKYDVHADGRLSPNESEHVPLLRFYTVCKPNAKETENGVRYWLEMWKQGKNVDIQDASFALESLFEYNSELHANVIAEIRDSLISLQQDNGSFGKEGYVMDTSYALSALSLVLPLDDPVMIKGKKFLIDMLTTIVREKNVKQYFHTYYYDSVPALVIALINLGEGTKSSKVVFEREIKKLSRNLHNVTPRFVQTTPDKHIRTLQSQVLRMIESAQSEILIVSPFVDMLYENLVDKINENPKIKIRMVSRPRKDFEGQRSKIGKNVLEILNVSTKNSLRVSDLVHSRMIIVDSNQLLVSSADLTREQLVDEYNAGLYTQDKASIKDATDYFNNLYNRSDELPPEKKQS